MNTPALSPLTSDRPATIAARAEQITKTTALVGAACYVLGLLATNFYLSDLKTGEFVDLKPICVLCGAVVLTILLIGASPVLVFRWPRNSDPRLLPLLRQGVQFVAAVVLSIGLIACITYSLQTSYDISYGVGLRPSQPNGVWYQGEMLSFFSLITGLCIMWTWHRVGRGGFFPVGWLPVIGIVLGVFSVLTWFAAYQYPWLPESLGGPSHREVILVVKDAEKPVFAATGIQFYENCPTFTQSVTLLRETDRDLTFMKAKQQPIKIDKTQIDAILYDAPSRSTSECGTIK